MANASTRYVTESGAPLYGVMAEFKDPAALYHACEQVRDAGYARWDAYSPFPIHGMEDAMGIRRTRLPLISAGAALVGAASGFALQWWVSNHGYALVTQGKPFGGIFAGGWQPFIPVTFEIGILFTAFTTLFAMLALNGLPRFHHPLMAKERFLGVTDDRFVVAIEAKDAKFHPDHTRELLRRAGATAIELVED